MPFSLSSPSGWGLCPRPSIPSCTTQFRPAPATRLPHRPRQCGRDQRRSGLWRLHGRLSCYDAQTWSQGTIGDAAPASSSTKHPPLHCYCVILLEQMSEPDPGSAFLSHFGVSDCQKVLDGDDSLEDENHRRFGRADDLFGHSPSRGSCLWSESLIP